MDHDKIGARAAFKKAAPEVIALSHRIHAHPEVKWEEVQACAWLGETLSCHGFSVEQELCDLPTAFEARVGSGPLHIVICAEYDALPGIGHACGHNVIAGTAVGAALALAAVADEVGITVRVMGTPAEEGGAGKIKLLERGAFSGAHMAMMTHPAPEDIAEWPIVASQRFHIRYIGKASHAAAYPELGVNAADALTLSGVAIGLLRQHMNPGDRVHGITTYGGQAPNIVPDRADAVYVVRGTTLTDLAVIKERVMRCFKAGALATGSQLEVEDLHEAYSQMHHDLEIVAAYRQNAETLGRKFSSSANGSVSTDMGNVSLAIPSIHPAIGLGSRPAVNHQPEFAAQCATASADKALADGAVALAWTAIDCATNDRIRSRLLTGSSEAPGSRSFKSQAFQESVE